MPVAEWINGIVAQTLHRPQPRKRKKVKMVRIYLVLARFPMDDIPIAAFETEKAAVDCADHLTTEGALLINKQLEGPDISSPLIMAEVLDMASWKIIYEIDKEKEGDQS